MAHIKNEIDEFEQEVAAESMMFRRKIDSMKGILAKREALYSGSKNDTDVLLKALEGLIDTQNNTKEVEKSKQKAVTSKEGKLAYPQPFLNNESSATPKEEVPHNHSISQKFGSK